MLQIRAEISRPYQSTSSVHLCERIKSMPLYEQAQNIALYSSVNGEIDLSTLWHDALAQGKNCYFPVLNEDQTLSFLPATEKTPFKENRYGIPEPEVSRDLAIAVDDIDLILIPLLAFDIRCTRLGMGAGYYDRTLENKKSGCFIGVAYQFQRVDFIEAQPWIFP